MGLNVYGSFKHTIPDKYRNHLSRSGNLSVIGIYPYGDLRAKEFKSEYFYVTIEGD